MSISPQFFNLYLNLAPSIKGELKLPCYILALFKDLWGSPLEQWHFQGWPFQYSGCHFMKSKIKPPHLISPHYLAIICVPNTGRSVPNSKRSNPILRGPADGKNSLEARDLFTLMHMYVFRKHWYIFDRRCSPI